MSREKIALGKKLFFDKQLSQDKTINCASCHKLNEGGDDNLATAIGHQGQANPSHLNSPTVLNSALAKFQFWDGRAKDVAEKKGGEVIEVDPKFTSQKCSCCGYISKENRKSQSKFRCVKCNFRLNADLNASLNILNTVGHMERAS